MGIGRVTFCEVLTGNLEMWNRRKGDLSELELLGESQKLLNDTVREINKKIKSINCPLFTPHISDIARRLLRGKEFWRWGAYRRDGVHLRDNTKLCTILLRAFNSNNCIE